MTEQQILAAAITEIYLGVAMARASGIVCGPPQKIRVTPIEDAPPCEMQTDSGDCA